jgi:hypothetical protein
VARYLVVAHQTVTNPELLKQVRSVKEKDEQAEFVLLVPATPVRHLLLLKGDEHGAQAAAEKLAAKARACRIGCQRAERVDRIRTGRMIHSGPRTGSNGS